MNNIHRYFLGFLISLLLLGLGELGGFLIIFIVNFGEGIDPGKNEICNLIIKYKSGLKLDNLGNHTLSLRNSNDIIHSMCFDFSLLSFILINKVFIYLNERGKTTKERLGKN